MPRRVHDAPSPLPAAASPRRVVVKIGSAVLAPGGQLDPERVTALARDIDASLRAHAGLSVVLVTSGAVASGFRTLGLERKPSSIVDKQAAAAVGQPRLMNAWSTAFAPRPVAQVLLTAEDIDDRARFLNARRTLERLLLGGCVPIINENDSVSYAEIRLGDNDHLSSLVAGLVSADLLVILSSVAGVWASAPSRRGAATSPPAIVPRIDSLAQGLSLVRTGTSSTGTGGMETKIRSACTAAALGTRVVIADGAAPSIVSRAIAGENVGTWFPVPDDAKATAQRKRWIGFSARPRGCLFVDAGARTAIATRGASLLARGLTHVEGVFDAGDPVDIADPAGHVFARGLPAYDASSLCQIAGKRSDQIEPILGFFYADEIVHRDDLALVGDLTPPASSASVAPSTNSTPPPRPRRSR